MTRHGSKDPTMVRPPAEPRRSRRSSAGQRSLKRKDLCDLVAAARRHAEDSLLQAELYEWCARFVKRWHWRGHDSDACQEIVQEALTKTYGLAEHRSLSDDRFAQCLWRALESEKKRHQRALSKSCTSEIDVDRRGHPPLRETEERGMGQDCIERTMNLLFEALSEVIPNLEERERQLLGEKYGIADWFPTAAHRPIDLKPSARRKALYRARKRLGEELEAYLLAHAADSEVRQGALNIVQGEVVDLFESFDLFERLDLAYEYDEPQPGKGQIPVAILPPVQPSCRKPRRALTRFRAARAPTKRPRTFLASSA